MKDKARKDIYQNFPPTLPDAFGRPVRARLIGFKRSSFGLGGIYVFPHIEGKHLYVINPTNPQKLTFIEHLPERKQVHIVHRLTDGTALQLITTRRIRRVFR